MASVSYRVNKDQSVTWRVNFRLDGKQRQASFLDPEGAEEFAALVNKIGGDSALQVLEARKVKGRETLTLREWTGRYLDADSGLLTGVEDATRDEYRRIAEGSFLKVLGDYPVDAIQKADVGRWVAWQERQVSARTKQPVSAKTMRNRHAILSAVFAAAVTEKIRDDNPAYRTRLTRGTKREGVFLTPDEFSTLLQFIPSRYETFILFLAGTGMRWGEATAITWGDLNLKAKPTARVNKAWKKGVGGVAVLRQPKSARSRRTISLFPDLVAALGEPGAPGELVFKNRAGNHYLYPSFRENVWTKAVAAANDADRCAAEGLEPLQKWPRIHDLRHSHASWLIAAGAPLPYVQARLGHESINTTVGVYGHLVPEAHEQMAGMIATTLAGVRPLRQIAS